jgi:hypothetical protein
MVSAHDKDENAPKSLKFRSEGWHRNPSRDETAGL